MANHTRPEIKLCLKTCILMKYHM